MTTEMELAALDENWTRNEAEKASGTSGILDPAEVDRIRRFRGWTTSYTYAALNQALAGEYEGTTEGGRDLLSAPGMVERRAERKGISVSQAELELAGTDSPGGAARIAELADEFVAREAAQGRQMDYATALGIVQKPGYRIAGETHHREPVEGGSTSGGSGEGKT